MKTSFVIKESNTMDDVWSYVDLICAECKKEIGHIAVNPLSSYQDHVSEDSIRCNDCYKKAFPEI